MVAIPDSLFLNVSKIKLVLEKLHQDPKKKFGQNFLHNKGVISSIISAMELDEEDIVLEIGPGLGAFTFPLAKKCLKIIAIEINESFSDYLKEGKQIHKLPNIKILVGNALEIMYPKGITKLYSSIPYSIAGPLIMKILIYIMKQNIPAFIICQEEFADKMMAIPGTKDYSRLSINTQFLSKIKKIMNISRNNFYPVPRVDSVLVKFIPRIAINENAIISFLDLTRGIFPYKNKTLRSALKHYANIAPKKYKIPLNAIEKVKIKHKRVRELDVSDILYLIEHFNFHEVFR